MTIAIGAENIRSAPVGHQIAEPTMEISLRQAPYALFDEQLWAIFVSYFQSAEIAYERISLLPGSTGYLFLDDPPLLHDPNPWRQIEEAAAVGRMMLWLLKEKLTSGEITATGEPFGFSGDVPREDIPASLWPRLWLNFTNNLVMGPGNLPPSRYDNVVLSWSKNPRIERAAQSARCADFLRKRKNEGETRRKLLLPELLKLEHIRIRDFNAVYGKVFKTKHGRPRLIRK